VAALVNNIQEREDEAARRDAAPDTVMRVPPVEIRN
jgi:hypothetical protein